MARPPSTASACCITVGLKRKPLALIKRLRKAKKEAPPMEKPAVVKTHLRNMIVVPEMIGSVVGIHSGKTFNQVEIKVCRHTMKSYNYRYCRLHNQDWKQLMCTH